MTGGVVITAAPKSEWNAKLFSIGEMSTCLYAWCLPCCAMASARTEYDESNFIFNLCNLTPSMTRNIIRQGYGIEGNACEDILLPCFVGPCVLNQLLTEVRKRGPIRGGEHGQQEWQKGLFSCDSGACMYAMCFPQCAVAESRKRYDDSSFLLNCLCSGVALNRSIIRTGYGLEGNCITDILFSCILPICVISQALQETKERGRVQAKPPAAGMH